MLPSRTIVLYSLLALLNMGVRRSFLSWALPMCYNPCGIDLCPIVVHIDLTLTMVFLLRTPKLVKS
ncbi:hypothetical protein GGU10DRAFT_358547 [Lentinula aff. detonsa]|uniref:Uncharacterized protein n=1 Tax=Lentinula aff. detonsa TaxID=2804958 RepID=A0AA38K9H4_9AGAR|nr:hypothetical protein GGU10DRAFT_358547 [Lentinula aff. detonsa]